MSESLSTDNILTLIHAIRDQRVILASDLAKLYGVQAKRLNEAVKRNKVRFPSDFMFQLTANEVDELADSRSQIATLKQGNNIKFRPYAFTEHGAIMAANGAILKRLAEIDKTLLLHDKALRDIYQKLLPLLQPPPDLPKPKIGFCEIAPRYGVRRFRR